MEEQLYLKPKREFQGLQGSLLNPNYYNARETVLSNAETTYVQSRWVQSFASQSWGTSAQFILSTDDLIGGTYLNITLKQRAHGQANDNPAAKMGWGLQAIRSISYMVPGSNVGRIYLDSTAIYHLLIGQNQDYATTTLMLMMAGQTLAANADLTNSNRSADILLPFFFSSMDPEVKPIDAYLFKSGSIVVTVELNAASTIFSANGANAAIDTIELSFRQGCYSNKANSLRDKLIANPSLSYSYPFIKVDTRTQRDVVSVSGAFPNAVRSRVNMSITGFLPADLVGLVITVHEEKNLIAGADLNPFLLASPLDLELTFASQIMYRSKHYANRLYGFQSVHSSGYDLAATGDFISRPNFPVFVDFAMKRQAAFGDTFFNTKRFEGQTMNLSFDPGFDSAGADFPDGAVIVTKVTLLYNSIIEIASGSAQVFGV